MALLQPRGPAATAAALGRSHSTATAPAPAPVGVIALPRTRSRGADHRGDRFYSPARVRRTIAKATPHDPANPHPFKGNVDLAKLQRVIQDAGPRKIPYVCIAGPVNMAGGQPQSMENMRAVRDLCRQHNIPVVLDATRAVENAYFIQQREPGYQSKRVAEILKEYCSYTDACTMSAKKDALVNIRGWLA